MPDASRDPTLDVSSAGAMTPPLIQTEAGFGQTLTLAQKRARVGVAGLAVLVVVGAGLVALRLRASGPVQAAVVTDTAHASESLPAPSAATIAPLPAAAPEATLVPAPAASAAPLASARPASSGAAMPSTSISHARPRASSAPARPAPAPSLANPTRL